MENPLICLNSLGSNVFPETVGDLLGDKNNLMLFTTLWASEGELPVFNISGGQLQNLTDPHPTPSHEFENQSVSWFDGAFDNGDLADAKTLGRLIKGPFSFLCYLI